MRRYRRRLRQAIERGGVGLENVPRRLQLCYGAESRLEFNPAAEGCQVSFAIPLAIPAMLAPSDAARPAEVAALRVLIADDEPIARQVLREHIESIPALEIAGEAATGAETLQRILDLKPDLVLLDLQMPELDGLAMVRSLRGDRTPRDHFRHRV